MASPRLRCTLVRRAAAALLGGSLLAGALGGCGQESAAPAPTPETDIARRTTELELARQVLGSPDVSLRRAAAKQLETRIDLPESAVRVLGLALSDSDRWVRESAAKGLREQGVSAASEVGRLIAALRDDDPYVRWRVAEALGRIGPRAVEAAAALRQHAGDADEVEVVRAASVKALERIEGAPGSK